MANFDPNSPIAVRSDDVRRIVRQIKAAQGELELEILRQPTGYVRNILTEANIHLLAAEEKLIGVV